MMKRSILAVILILGAVFCVYGQNAPIDLILMLDTSASMSSSYETVNNYITGAFLSEFLRIGDTFHLIPFSGKPRIDAARRVQGRGDVETIIGRILLQYPVESGNDLRAAISFAEGYASDLPPRPKKIVIVSTGGPDAAALVNSAKQRLGAGNTTLDFVQVVPGQPLANLPKSGRSARPAAAATPPAAAPAQAAAPAPSAPAAPAAPVPAPSQTQGRPDASVSTPAEAAAPAPSAPAAPAPPLQEAASSAPAAALDPVTPQAEMPPVIDESAPSQPAENAPVTEPVTPVQTEPAPSPSPAPASSGREKISWKPLSLSLPLLIAVIIAALLILGLIIFFVIRNLRGSPNRAMAMAASGEPAAVETDEARFPDHSRELASYAAVQTKQRTTPYADRPAKIDKTKTVINPSGPLLLNLFVEDQNTAIGKRNIHSLKSGYSLSVGGGKSDFLIFLVPIPSNIGEIRRDSGQCTFVPRKPKFFPDLGSGELKDCINKTIRVVSDKNYELRFRFEQYEDPLVALNRMLNSLRVPG